METYQDILQSLVLTLLTAGLPILLNYLRKWLLDRVGREHLDTAAAIAKTVVMAIEQAGDKTAAEKKREAVQLMDGWLQERGINIDLVQIDALIEAAVYNELNRWQLIEPAGEKD